MIKILPLLRTDDQLHVNSPAFDPFQADASRHGDILINHFVTTHLFQFSYGILIQSSVPHGQFPGQAHLSEPAHILRSDAAGVPVLHPSDHDSSSVGRQYRLRRIEIDTVIDRLVILFCKSIRLFVIRTDQTQCPVAVMVFKSRRKHILRAYKQDALAIQPKEVGTLPHLTEPVIVCRQHLLILPCKTVLAGIQKDLPAAVRRSAANRTAVSSIAFSPHLRIPEVIPAAPFRQILLVKNRILLILLVVRSVTDRQTLRLYFAKTAVPLPFSQHAGIHQQLTAVIHCDCTAGEAAVPVISFIRSQRRRKIFPVQKIVAHRMSPVHRSPLGIIRIILVEHMIFSAIIRKPIGIVQPARAHGQMKIRPFLLCYHLSRQLLNCHTR